MREGGRQCSCFLDSQTQTGKELDEIDGRSTAITNRDDIATALGCQLTEKVLRVEIGIVERAENIVSLKNVQ